MCGQHNRAEQLMQSNYANEGRHFQMYCRVLYTHQVTWEGACAAAATSQCDQIDNVVTELKGELETEAMTTSSQCNTGRMCVRLPIITRENTPLAIHVVQKITIIRVQKIGKSAVWNLILCRGAIWRRRKTIWRWVHNYISSSIKSPQNIPENCTA